MLPAGGAFLCLRFSRGAAIKNKEKLFMKRTLLYIGSVVILVLAAVTFVFVPAAAPSAQGKALVFGKYDGKKIEYAQGTEFANAVANYVEIYRNQGSQLDDSTYFYIYNYAFNAAVQAIAYASEVKNSGYEPSDLLVNLSMMPYFSENGTYSPALFEQVPQDDREALRADVKKRLIWNRYSEDLLGSEAKVGAHTMFGLKTAEKEIPFFADMANTKRSFDMAAFDLSDYPESQVKSYAENNGELFAKYDFSIVTTEEKAQAEDVLKKLTDNEIDFENAISEFSEKYYSENDGKISASYAYQIKQILKNDDDADALFALEIGKMSGVIETARGFSIFKCDGEKKESDFEDASAVETIRNYIKAHEAGIIEDYFIAEAKNLSSLAVTKGFDEACSESGIAKIEVPAFPLNYGNASIAASVSSDIKELASAGRNENFLQSAFTLKNGEISEPIVIGNYVIVLKMTGEQKDDRNEEQDEAIQSDILYYDKTAAQSTLLASDKVENNVSSVFFNTIMLNK